MQSNPAQLSKFLSFVLRHKPDAIGLIPIGVGVVQIIVLADDARREGTVDYLREGVVGVVGITAIHAVG